MIRLVLSDLDGTLLPAGETALRPELFAEIRRLKSAGIDFCPASGRQLTSLRRIFAPIADEIYYLAQNGAAVYLPGKENRILEKKAMDRETALELCHDLLEQPEGQLLLTGDDRSYILPKTGHFVWHVRDFLGNRTVILQKPEEMPEEILSVSLYSETGREDLQRMEARLTGKWSSRVSMAVAGSYWIDFTTADKGTGAEILCRRLGLERGELMAFGDNYNDVPMLETAGVSYLMSNAAEPLRRRFPNQCADVLDVLKTLG